MHLEAGFINPLDGNWELKMVFKGISRMLGVPPKQKSPMTPTILILLHRSLVDTNLDHTFWCACLLAFFGFLRKATLLPASGDLVPGKFIARGDVINFSLSSFLLLIRGSKTIQFGQRVHSVPYAACPDSRLCPVRALLKHLGRSPLPLASPMFNYVSNGVEIRLTHEKFIKRLRKGLTRAGLNPLEISGHSFRRGGATLAFKVGMSAIDIKLRGDWASNAFENYVFVSPATALHSAQLLANAAACNVCIADIWCDRAPGE
jgi:hypothetical protein